MEALKVYLPDGRQNPAWHRAYYEAHREARLEKNREYRRTHPRTRHIARECRAMVISLLRQRDGDDCWICGHAIVSGDESPDHVHPKCKGGTEDATNIRLAHRVCNMRRSRSG